MINFLFTALILVTPLILNLANSEFFEVPKMYFVYLISLLLLVSHLVNFLRGRVPLIKKHVLLLPFFIFILSQSISTFFSIDTHTSIYGYYSRLNGGLLSLLSYAIIFVVFLVYRTPSLITRLISTSLFAGFLVASYGILEHFGIDKHFWVQDVETRVFSTLGQPNWLAAYLCILLPLALDRILNSSSTWLKILYSTYFLSFYLCLLYTKSKSGIIAGLVSLAIYSLIHLIKNKKRHLKPLAASLVFVVFCSVYITNPIKDRLFPSVTTTPTDLPTSPILVTPSEDIRKIVWRGSLDLWRQFPLFGTGPETFAYSYYWTRPASHNLTSEWNFIYNKAHNEYLNYLSTSGTFGFLSYVVLIGFILLVLLNSPALFASFVSILITNFAGFSVVVTSLYFFLIPLLVLDKDRDSTPITTANLFSKNKLLQLLGFLGTTIIFFNLLARLSAYFLADIAYRRQSLPELRYALNYRPNEPVFLSKYALVLAENSATSKDKSKIDDVVKSLDNAITISPFNINLWKERAQGFYYLSLLDSQYYVYTIDALTKATRLAPTDASSFYLLGKFYQNISEYDSAIANYQKAIELKPNYDHASFMLGEIYYQQKKYQEAKAMFEKTLQIAPSNPDAKKYLDEITLKKLL